MNRLSPIRTIVRPARLMVRLMSGGGNMHNNDPEIIERAMKRKKNHKASPHKHAPGWNEDLASESEASIKAEQHKGPISPNDTIQYLKNRDSDDPNAAALCAEDEEGHTIDSRDIEAVTGPLAAGSKAGHSRKS